MKLTHAAVVFVVIGVSMVAVVKIDFGVLSGGTEMSKCTGFQGDINRARWDGCTTPESRGIDCRPFVDNVLCYCLRDGVEGRHFTAVAPPFADRAAAERVWAAQCR